MNIFDAVKDLDEESTRVYSEMYKGNELADLSEAIYWARHSVHDYKIRAKVETGETLSIDDIVARFREGKPTEDRVVTNLHRALSCVEMAGVKLNLPVDLSMILKEDECPYISYWTQSSMHC